MNLNDKEPACHPQHIVMNAFRMRIEKFGEILSELSTRLCDVEKTINNKEAELSARIDNVERQIDGLKGQLVSINKKLVDLEDKYTEMNDFLKETKIKWTIWTKCLMFMKEFPGHIVAFIGAVTAIIMYLSKFFGL